MKKGVLLLSLFGLLIIVLIIFSSHTNMINLLVDGTTSTGGGTGGSIGKSKSGDAPINEEGKSFISGLGPTINGGINLLYLLQNASSVDSNSYAYQLLQAYSNLSSGKFNDFEFHISPDALVGSHNNETSLASFVVKSYSLGQSNKSPSPLGTQVNGKILTLENATKKDLKSLGMLCSDGSSVCYDANSDGIPDGPFQILDGNQSGDLADKTRGDKVFDPYSFVDAMNFEDRAYSKIAAKFAQTGETPDPRVLTMLTGLAHNRGDAGVIESLFGFPYYKQDPGSYLKEVDISNLSAEQLQAAAKYSKNLLSWFDQANIPFEVVEDNNSGQAVALLLNLAHGGFLDIALQRNSESTISKLDDTTIKKIFPEQTKSTIISYINNKYVKNPWDVLGISKSEYSKIYGLTGNNYEEYYSTAYDYKRNTSFFIDSNTTSDIYKAKDTAVVVRAVEGISLGYMLNTGVTGTYTLLNLAIDAGIKSLTDGTIIDPSNPANLYMSAGQGTYNPASAEPNFDAFLAEIGMVGELTPTQYNQLSIMYKWTGTTYNQEKRGILDERGLPYLDCSSFVNLGLFLMEQLSATRSYASTATIMDGVWMKDNLVTYRGQKYNARVYQLDKKGKPLMDGRSKPDTSLTYDNATDWGPYLQPGDILVYNGHTVTFVGQNTTGRTIKIDPALGKISGISKEHNSTYMPGDYMMFAASSTANASSIRHLWGENPYVAFRPAYNIK
jgi:hypothetical protein